MATVRKTKFACLATTALISIGGWAVGSAAWAQVAATAQANSASTTGEPAKSDGVAEVVVTASRIQGANFTSPSPVTELGAKDLEARAVARVSTILFELPSIRPLQNAGSSTNIGGAFINLRSLGPQRNLTLIDGRRVVASQLSTNSVDTNMIPSLLIQRIDVVTTGASAAWGSDAIAGVTNFVMNKKLDGFMGNAQFGMTNHNDNKEINLGLAWGGGFAANRGHVVAEAEYNNLYDTPRFKDRDWTAAQYQLLTPVTINGVTYSRAAVPGTTLSNVTSGGLITGATAINNTAANNAAALALFRTTAGSAPVTGTTFNAAGQPITYTYGTNVGSAFQTGGDGPWPILQQPLAAPVKRKNLYGHVDYALTDNINLFAEGAYASSYTSPTPYIPIWSPNSGDTPLTILSGNPFLPASIQQTMTTAGIASLSLGRLYSELQSFTNVTTIDTTRFAFGADGAIGGWKWNGYYSHGHTHYVSDTFDDLIEPNLRAAVDVVRGPAGTPICRVNSTLASDIAIVSAPTYQGFGASSGCTPLNPFGAGSIGSSVASYIQGAAHTDVGFTQDVAEGSVQGSPFSTWAGKVTTVIGAGWRREAVLQTSDPTSTLTTSTYPGGSFQFGNTKPIMDANGNARHLTVKEGYGEIELPLLKDAPFAQSFNLNGAVRFTDYSTSGSVTTWKVGGTYQPIQDVLFRATSSHDIRAANLNELYAGSALGGGQVTDFDPRVTTAASGTQYVSLTSTVGNPNLKPEISNSRTVGVSLRPRFIPRLDVSFDAYHLHLTNEIGTLGGQNVINACFGKNKVPQNTALCSLIIRDPSTSRITSINNTFLNVAGTRTSGVDAQANYRIPLGDGSNLTLRFVGSYVAKFVIDNSLSVVDYAGSVAGSGGVAGAQNNPHYRFNVSTTYDRGPLTVLLTGRYLGPAKYDNTFNVGLVTTDIYNNRVPSRLYFDGSIQYKGPNDLNFYLQASNIFDKNPPIVPGNQLAPVTSLLYDNFGRKITVGVRFRH